MLFNNASTDELLGLVMIHCYVMCLKRWDGEREDGIYYILFSDTMGISFVQRWSETWSVWRKCHESVGKQKAIKRNAIEHTRTGLSSQSMSQPGEPITSLILTKTN